MKAFRNLILFVIGSIILLFLFGWYSGFFVHAEIEVKTVNSFLAVAETHTGDYTHTDEIQEKIYDLLWEKGIDNYSNFCIFYDNPVTEDSIEMESIAGRVVANFHEEKIKDLNGRFKIYTFNEKKAATVELPVKNIFSLYAGVYKAYPLLRDYAIQNDYKIQPIIEVYDIPGTIQFIMPLLAKQK